ncbi:hypothetical protein [Daejeonella sp.]|uniref:hypothetical protein n=1 Tax=Daejeonella sp. TaxID=2805397 RepID=UPI00273029D9|nr:hypothetical protein [Daejeonella sp.]MDP2414620.1 hypothetical protein [Daejeonella sp.]
MTVFTFAEEKSKTIEKIEPSKVEAQVSSMETEKMNTSLDIKKISTSTSRIEIKVIENCYGGMTSCGIGYMWCQEQPLTGADQLTIWDAFNNAYCG